MEYSTAQPVWPASLAGDLTAYWVHFGDLQGPNGETMKFDQYLWQHVSPKQMPNYYTILIKC
jgi:hypothetical protein